MVLLSALVYKYVNEGIKSKGCDGSGSGGRLNRPLALLQIKIIYQEMQHDGVYHYILLHTSDSSHFHPKIMFHH